MLNEAAASVPPEPLRRAHGLLVAHAVAAAVLIGLLTGCSETISPPSHATGQTSRSASMAQSLPAQTVRPSAPSAVTSNKTSNKTLLKYVHCVARHGGGNLAVLTGATPAPSQKAVSPAKAQEAAKACQGLLKTAFRGTAVVSSGQAALNSFARCMGSHGVQVQPDLQAVKYLKLSDLKISSAMSKCRSQLPKAAATPTTSPH